MGKNDILISDSIHKRPSKDLKLMDQSSYQSPHFDPVSHHGYRLLKIFGLKVLWILLSVFVFAEVPGSIAGMGNLITDLSLIYHGLDVLKSAPEFFAVYYL